MLNQVNVKEMVEEQTQAVNKLNNDIALIKGIPQLDLLETRCRCTDFYPKKRMIGVVILENDIKAWEGLSFSQQCSNVQKYQNLINLLAEVLIEHHSIDINRTEVCGVLSWAARTSNAPLMELLLNAGAKITGGIHCDVISGFMASKTEPADPMLAVLWKHKQNTRTPDETAPKSDGEKFSKPN